MKAMARALAVIAALLLASPGLAGGEFDGDGYRAARYRAPVDRDPRPAAHLALAAARLLHPGRDALFIDVLPVDGGVRDPETGEWRLSTPHQTIPGAVWHPEVGRASPDLVLWQALVAEIGRSRRRNARLPVVIFCRADCWMGWNAARRLASQGFEDIWWLAEGIEGWREAEDLVAAKAVAVPTTTNTQERN